MNVLNYLLRLESLTKCAKETFVLIIIYIDRLQSIYGIELLDKFTVHRYIYIYNYIQINSHYFCHSS